MGEMRTARVDLAAIAGNVRAFIHEMAPSRVLIVVKADAYGHGALPVARAAQDAGAHWIGTADLREALALREGGITAPLLCWLHGPDTNFAAAVAADICVAVSSLAQLRAMAAAAGDTAAHVQLKLETGLSRNGAEPHAWAALFAEAAALEAAGTLRVSGIMSHLSNTDAPSDAAQLALFNRGVAEARAAGLSPELTHIAATAGALTLPEARLGMVRIGIGTYGVSPFEDATPTLPGLRPAMTLGAPVIAVRRVPAGTGISYGYTQRTERETTLALIPLGYADGLPRHASGRALVNINGKNYPLRGRIAMDQCVLEIGEDAVSVGDRAVVFGDPATGVPSAWDLAHAAESIGYEIITRIGPRVIREYVSEGTPA
ncbi:alanine racemase [Mycetocola spongiae]|uniref:alanine racemase n=1 Tax=Mycetocola spongiae TaxID=2859226 RepID=UPI001CF42CD0|nr:alanine racemase [Mycetocola spongiae]UCR88610.1 alanine racemase [Mycetocola spongiae]